MALRADWDYEKTGRWFWRRWVSPITVAAVLLALTTGLVFLIDAPLQHDHLIFIYLVPTALIAIRYGSISAMFVAIVSTFAAAYFLYVPRYSFAVASLLDFLELLFFSMLALLASQVVSGFASDRDIQERRVRRARREPPRSGWGSPLAWWRRARLWF